MRAFVANRQKAYQLTFAQNEATKLVMEDLKRFCRAEESCFHADPRLHAVLEGRREVFLRIQKHLELDPESLATYFLRKENK